MRSYMSVELDDLANRAEAAGYPILAAGYRRDAQLIREFSGPEYFSAPVPEPISFKIQEKTFTRSAVIPELIDPTYKQIVQKANPVVGLFDDNVTLEDLIRTQEWSQLDSDLLRTERAVLNRAIYGLTRGRFTLGKVRTASTQQLLEVRNIGPKMATFLINVVQPVDISNT